MNKKLLYSILLAIVAIMSFALSKTNLYYIDDHAREYFKSSITKTAITYASIRGLNAIVSIVKESELELSPAGVGVNIAFGQFLDPIDDMTEQFSTFLLVGIVALGIERLLLELVNSYAFFAIGIISLVLIIFMLLSHSKMSSFLTKIIVAIFALRLLLPLNAFVSDFMHNSFEQRIIEIQKVLNFEKNDDFLQEREERSFFDRFKNGYSEFTSGVKKLKDMFFYIKSNLSNIVSAIIELSTIYVFLFLMDIIILPILGFFIIFRGLKHVFLSTRDIF